MSNSNQSGQKKPYFITTAIAYTSQKPHIGNVYESIFTDAVARFHRLKGEDVFFLTGTDEHGQKIEDAAKERGIAPQAYVDEIAGEIRSIYDFMNISYDKFIRTTDKEHERVVQKIFKKFYEQGDIYKGSYEGLYCKPCESFFTETQLIDGKCPDCGSEVKKTSEEAYFFKMSKYQDRLMKHIEENPDFITPESRKREMVNNFLKPGLQDLCVSRTSFTWGVPVDFDDRHVVYVWVDALSNYITALGYDPDGSSPLFEKYWPADVHVIGKDILRFHTIYWPIFLMALGLPLPNQVFGHPWMLFGKDKMSKSKGNVIYADELAKQFSVDAVRYYALSEMPYGQDGAITYETVVARYNSDLANTLGNLVNRSIAMANKYFEGKISNPKAYTALDNELILACKKGHSDFTAAMEDLRLGDATESIMELARRANKYIDETMPWALAKDEQSRDCLQQVLYCLLEAIRILGILLLPIIPQTAEKIFSQLGRGRQDQANQLEVASSFGLEESYQVGEATPLFARVDEAEKLKELHEFADDAAKKRAAAVNSTASSDVAAANAGVASLSSLITIEDFQKVSLKACEIKLCEPVKKSDKLLRLLLDDGSGNERQIVSGIAEWYRPDDLVGKKVIVVANLKPAKLRGVESNGMLLAADCPNGLVKVIFVDSSIPNGSKIR